MRATILGTLCIKHVLPCSVAGHNNESLISPFDYEVSVERDAEIFIIHFRDVFDVDT